MRAINKHSAQKLLAMLLILATLLVLAAPALAAYNEQVYATTALNVRSGPGTNYPIVGSLKQGQTVTRVGTSGNWSIIELGNKKVYAYSSYLRVSGSTSGQEQTYYTTGRVNVRTGPGTGYKVLTTLNKGDKVIALGRVGNWTVIKWNDGTAYMYTKYLTSSGSGGGTGGVQPATGTMVATSNVNVRSGPSTSYSIMGWLAKGQAIERTGITGSWTQVKYNGKIAYVHSGYLKVQDNTPVVTPASGVVEATLDVNVRKGPGTEYTTMGLLQKGERVKRTGTVGNWTRVEFNGREAYVFTSYLRVVNEGVSEKRYLTENATMYAGPGTNYGVVRTMSAGDVVIYLSRNGNWALVEYGSKTGYLPLAVLSTEPYQPISGTAYAPQRTRVYADAGSNPIGYVEAGEGFVVTGKKGNWTTINFNGKTGYVASADVVVLSAASQTQFTKAERDMYSKADYLYVYTIPSENSAYRYGWMPKDEKVERIAYNSTWSMVRADGRILYTRTENLVETPSTATGPKAGDPMTIKASGALMYLDAAMQQIYIHKDSSGATVSEKIPAGAVVEYRATDGGAYLVYWSAIDKTIYIDKTTVV